MSDNAKTHFFQFRVPSTKNPIEEIKRILLNKKSRLSQSENQSQQQDLKIDIKNIEDFLDLINTIVPEGSIKHISKTNNGIESGGTSTILLIASSRMPKEKQNLKVRQWLVKNLYQPDNTLSQKAYFIPTLVPYIYEWWEEGQTEVTEHGIFHNDIFKGFVKINDTDFERLTEV